MFTLHWRPVLGSGQLAAAANPALANQPEAIPWILYDTQTYTSGTTTTLSFFASTNNDKTLSNMESSGQLPDPQYLIVNYVTCDILVSPSVTTTAAVTGALNDIELLLKAARATFTLSMSNKNYGPFPLRACHPLGGATGIIAAEGTETAAARNIFQAANSGIPGSGGFPFMGALVIPPKVGFGITVNFAAAQTLAGGNPNIQIGLAGILYRRVL